MKKIVTMLLIMLTIISWSEAKTESEYYKELKLLTDEQAAILVLAYEFGKDFDLETTLAAIVWKESSFGRNLVNKEDGQYGSFGIAQVLLQSAMSRVKIDHRDVKKRKMLLKRLITDHKANLSFAVAELLYWKNIYKYKKKSKWWYVHMLASYNAGWKGMKNPKGKKYAEDVMKRSRAIKKFIQNKKDWNPIMKKYLGTGL